MKTVKVDNKELFKLVIEHLNNNQEVELKVMGNSMLPFYKHDKTVVTLKKQETYQKHDVVLFDYEGQTILHRIIKIKGNDVIIRGDGAFRKEVVTKDLIHAKVIDFETNGKKIKNYQFKFKVWLFFTPIRRILLKFIKK